MKGKGIFIAGTDTEVGKTFTSCLMLQQYRRSGINALGMKPIASGMELVDDDWVNEDVEKIWQASDRQVERHLLNQYAYRPFIAPHQAAARQGEAISLDAIHEAYRQLEARADQVLVEGAGGLMTPVNDHQTFVELVQLLRLDVILVVAIRLGCINHALLTQRVMQCANINFRGWVANYPDEQAKPDQDIEQSLEMRLDAPLLGVIPWKSSGFTAPEFYLG